MHYRKTGKLAKRLLDAAPPDSPLHLYAIGYLTHVAADTVGHPYVNAISGGPYRSHAQRHKASENYQDVFNFLAVKSDDFNFSELHALYNFNFNGHDRHRERRPGPVDAPAQGPLVELIADALNEIYDEDGTAPRPDYAKRLDPARRQRRLPALVPLVQERDRHRHAAAAGPLLADRGAARGLGPGGRQPRRDRRLPRGRRRRGGRPRHLGHLPLPRPR